jgi:hypothetical protein
VDFVSTFIEYTSVYESPSAFWKWSAYATIAAILRDNCFLQLKDIKIYPNIYVLLLADSAVQRKGNPVKFCANFVKAIHNTKLIAGRSSIQGILDELARGETDKATGEILKGGSAIFNAQELSANIVNDPEAIKILTDIYDFYESYESRLRGMGYFRIPNVCFSMLAASNETLLRDVYDTKATVGGLLGRTFLILPDEFRPGNSLFNVNHSELSFDSLVGELKLISRIRGKFTLDTAAQETYDAWYIPFRDSYKGKADKSGIAGRIHTSVLKLAMLLCVNHTKDLIIKKEHIEESLTECLALIPNYNQFVMSSGKSPLKDVAIIVLNEIHDAPDHCTSKRNILSKHWSDIDSETMDKVMLTLIEAGMIINIMQDNEILYKMTEKCLEMVYKGEKK